VLCCSCSIARGAVEGRLHELRIISSAAREVFKSVTDTSSERRLQDCLERRLSSLTTSLSKALLLGGMACGAGCGSTDEPRDGVRGAGTSGSATATTGSAGAPSAGGGNGSGGSSSGEGGEAPVAGAGAGGQAGAPRGGAGSGSAGDAQSGAGSGGAGRAGGGASGADAGGAGGSAGTGGSGGATVELPEGVAALFPVPGSENICPDPPLRITFPGTPSLGNTGTLRVYDADTPGDAVVSVDFSQMTRTAMRGGQSFTLERAVSLDGNTVVVTLDPGALDYGKRYYVTLDAGAVRGPGDSTFSLDDASGWTFRTLPGAPAKETALRVALDGGGQFCSLQGAFDAVPNGNEAATSISIGAGSYFGVSYVNGKHNLTIQGDDRKKVVLSGVNNNDLNPSTRGRALLGADDADGLTVENLTIQNLTPQGGSQAEALRLQNCDRCVVRDADILSLQDTLLWSGRVYAENCYIEGNVDFVWGTGVAYFDRCELKTVGRSGYVVQARNGADGYGYVFVDSLITSDAGLTGSVLARIDASEYPDSHVAYVDCTLGAHIASAGFTITGTPSAALRFWEYRSKNPAGALLDTSGRVQGATQISAEQAALMRDKAHVLGGWEP
jgi:pectin methylesterase-like acyl-CoA thioesterase